jgi:hypothetical protein
VKEGRGEMQCAILKHPRCSSLENINVEQQQQSLFDVSIIKLQHEQLRHGVEPRLLRFVLINNALRSLQGHMLQIENEDTLMEITGAQLQNESSDLFFYNTFKNGSLSSLPLVPSTPVKMMKLDNNLANQSPLVEYQEAPCSSHDILTTPPGEDRVQPAACYDGVRCEVVTEEEEEVEGGEGKERRMLNGLGDVHSAGLHLGKRSRDWSHDVEGEGGGGGVCLRDNTKCRQSELKDSGTVGNGLEGFGGSDAKKPCKPPNLIINCTVQKVQNGLNGLGCLNNFLDLDSFPSLPFPSSPPSPSSPSPLSPSSLQQTPHYHHTNHFASPSEDLSDKDSLTPSPIDFTNVDPTLYDFDTAVLQVGNTDSVPALDNHHNSLPSTTITPLQSPLAETPISSGHTALTSTTIPAVTSSTTTPVLSPSPSQFSLTSDAVIPTVPPSAVAQQGSECVASAEATLPSYLVSESTASAEATLPSYLVAQQGNKSTASSEATLPSYLESDKLSLLSANSLVSTYPPGGGSSKGGASCSMEALVRAQNGGDLLNEEDDDCSLSNGGSLGNSNGRSLPTSPEHGTESECIDEIEHIVKLLMT